MLSVFKKITVLIVLASFLMIALLSFSLMTHGPDGRMGGECPFSAMGASLCPQNTLAVALHHISAYNSLLAAPTQSGITALIAVLLFVASLVLLLSVSPPAFSAPARAGSFFDSPRATPQDRKEIRWLSLFENSPSV